MKKISILLAFCLFINFAACGYQAESLSKTQELKNETIDETLPPHILVIFGATGDLTKRKLIPAVVQLKRKGLLPDQFVCIGVGRREMSPAQYHNEIGSFIANEDREIWESFRKKMIYFSGNFEKKDTYARLLQLMQNFDQDLGTKGNRLFYLATPPANFAPIIEQIHQNGLLTDNGHPANPWSRVIIEKPFGHDLASAVELQQEITRHLNESQIYLIDHYLGKEVVHNLLTFRFDNPFIESFWNNQLIDHVTITLSEDIGVGTRGAFWEQTGLLRDLVQNHIMQLVSLAAMERPSSFDAADIRKEKIKLIESIRPFQFEKLDSQIMRGQYGSGKLNGTEIPGYRQETGVAADSPVETFVAARLFIDNARWSGVRFTSKQANAFQRN